MRKAYEHFPGEGEQQMQDRQAFRARALPGSPVPNTIAQGDDFYVSYNDCDVAIYGCATTALVVGQMERFYILKGDHRARYAPLICQGFAACLSYFKQHLEEAHEHSDPLCS